jgi:hypothetical protein
MVTPFHFLLLSTPAALFQLLEVDIAELDPLLFKRLAFFFAAQAV